jgi:hypothetical protein
MSQQNQLSAPSGRGNASATMTEKKYTATPRGPKVFRVSGMFIPPAAKWRFVRS